MQIHKLDIRAGLFFVVLFLCAISTAHAQTVDEEMRVDDGTVDGTPISVDELVGLNRFTPSRYPAMLKAVKIFFRRTNPSPIGSQIHLIVFGSNLSVPSVSFARPASFVVNQPVTVPEVSTTGEFVEFALNTPVQIDSGDVFVGFQQPAQTATYFWLDGSEPYPLRSYIILPNDNTARLDFFPTVGFSPAQPAVNFMIRAVMSVPAAPPPLAAVSAASYFTGDVAAESIVAVFGANLASNTAVATTVPLPTTLNGSSVKITDSANVTRDAGLFFVSAGQINLEIPKGTSDGAATLAVTNGSGQIFSTRINVRAVVPGVFVANANGLGVAAAELLRIKADGSLSYEPVARFDTASNQWVPRPIVFGPESEQAFLILYGTGLRNRSDLANARVNVQQFNGVQFNVLYAGPQSTASVGLDQVNVALPRTLAGKGEMHVRLLVEGRTANLFKLNFQ